MDSSLLVNDLVENEVGSHKPPQDDDFKSPATGFPAPKKRVSAFKQRKAAAAAGASAPANKPAATSRPTPQASQGGPSATGDDFYATEKRRIDRENRELLRGMAPAEIEEARRQLMSGLDASLIERLFKRANIDEQNAAKSPFDDPSASRPPPPTVTVEDVSEQAPATAAPKQPAAPKAPSRQPVDEDRAPDRPPENLFPISDAPKSTHFPAPNDPDLDPSDPDFLESLHTKYFPNLPADPSKLAWMAPLPTEGSHADKESPYFPDQATVSTSALRFDFTGRLLPPRLSRSIPVSKGLHHHGQAPEAAGYTVEELSILARSAVPAQRCMAFQTLGRILYRLGKGEWGTTIDDAMAMGIWHSVKEGRVLDSLAEAAAQEHGHRSSQAFALEALWLFEKGGGRRRLGRGEARGFRLR